MSTRRHALLLAAVAVLALVGAIGGPGGGTEANTAADAPFVEVTNGTFLWPYTSHSRAFEGRTLAINVIVYGDPVALKRHLTEGSRADWNETDAEIGDVDPIEAGPNATLAPWTVAKGAARYTYVHRPADETAAWLDASYQLHDGDYFGARHHLRVYEGPADGDRWVAIQAHHEHWDWFRLRHTVDGVQHAQATVEREFMDRRVEYDIARAYVGNTQGPDMDGWVTVIGFGVPGRDVLAGAILAIGLPALRHVRRTAVETTEAISERARRMALLAIAISTLYLTIRFGSIGVERYVPLVDPPYAAVGFYPVLLVGLPACSYWFARRLDRSAAFGAAVAGFIAAILLDYAYLQISVLPIDTLVHRLALAVALGLVAMGAAEPAGQRDTATPSLRVGILLWLSALALPLLRFV